MLAPIAVSVVVCPEQIVERVGVIVILGLGIIVTDETAVFVHEPIKPVTVYDSLTLGVVVTRLSVVDDNDGELVHEYEFAPLAVRLADEPAQILAFETIIVGEAITVTCLQ